jgi:hypothetical protein
LVLDGATGTGGWIVQPVGGPVFQKGRFSQGADRVQFAISPAGLDTVTFTGIGTILSTNADGSVPFDTVDVTSTVSGTRSLRVLVGGPAGGARTGVKVCDPAWNAIDPADPKACPTG